MQSDDAGWRAGDHHEQVAGRAPASLPSDRVFGLAGSALLVGLLVFRYLRTGQFRWWMIATAGVLAACALVAPSILSPLNRAWIAVGQALSRITSPVVLAAIYWVAIVPVGLIMRLLRRDPLARRFDEGATTYWSSRPAERGDMKNQF